MAEIKYEGSDGSFLFILKNTDSRTHTHISNDAGVRYRVQNKAQNAVTAEWGCESNTISNRPAYFRGQGDRHLLLAPGADKSVFIAEKDPGTNVGNPAGMVHVITNSATKPAFVAQAAGGQSDNIAEMQDASGNVLSKFDKDGDLVLKTYDDAGRPAAGVAGRLIFNTDDGNLNIDDGTNWILPDGTTT